MGAIMILLQSNISTNTVATIVGYLAQHTNVCAKLLDRDGSIIAVNRVGLDIIGLSQDEICGLRWATLWEGESRQAVDHAIAESFAGRPCQIVVSAEINGAHSSWDIEALPCDWENGQVTRILVLSTPVADGVSAENAEKSRETVAALGQILHNVANLSASAIGAANLLRRGLPDDQIEALAQSLEDSGRDAVRSVNDLKSLIAAPSDA